MRFKANIIIEQSDLVSTVRTFALQSEFPALCLHVATTRHKDLSLKV